jgi:hypothetical protein
MGTNKEMMFRTVIEELLLSTLVIAGSASDVAQRRHLLVEHVVVSFQFALHPTAVHVLGVYHHPKTIG